MVVSCLVQLHGFWSYLIRPEKAANTIFINYGIFFKTKFSDKPLHHRTRLCPAGYLALGVPLAKVEST